MAAAITDPVRYSQNGEQEAILKIFGESEGRFLDIGAYDGKTFSNTLALIERGWSGVLIEPSPNAFMALADRHRGNDRLELIMAAVGCAPGIVIFYNSPDAVSTTDNANFEKWKGHADFSGRFYVPQITVEQILIQFGSFHFVNIDTEGTSTDIFLQLPLATMRPKAVCVEHDGRTLEILQRATPLGYICTYADGNNLILALS